MIAADRRARELARIRQLFVPELILRLHTLLVSSRTHIPECVSLFFRALPRPNLYLLAKKRPTGAAPGKHRCRLAIYALHGVRRRERAQVERVSGCRPHGSACRVGAWGVGPIQS